jgi:hypothetical protein
MFLWAKSYSALLLLGSAVLFGEIGQGGKIGADGQEAEFC